MESQNTSQLNLEAEIVKVKNQYENQLKAKQDEIDQLQIKYNEIKDITNIEQKIPAIISQQIQSNDFSNEKNDISKYEELYEKLDRDDKVNADYSNVNVNRNVTKQKKHIEFRLILFKFNNLYNDFKNFITTELIQPSDRVTILQDKINAKIIDMGKRKIVEGSAPDLEESYCIIM